MTTSPPPEHSAVRPARIIVWDWTIRVFHWALVALIAVQWWTAENGYMNLHSRFGLAVLGLLVFRIYWGIVGAGTARFSQFVKGPREILEYGRGLRRPYKPAHGHNPIGALSVLLMLAALGVHVIAGLFAVDVDGIDSGPLSRLVSFELGRFSAEIHETTFNVLLSLIVLHLVAIAFYYFVLRANLVSAMITGRRQTDEAENAPARSETVPILRAAIGVLVAGLVVYIVQL